MDKEGDLPADFLSTEKFTDMQGNDLFTLKNKHLTLHKSFHAQGPGGHDIFQVKGHFTGWYCPSCSFMRPSITWLAA